MTTNANPKTMAEYQALGQKPDVLFWVGCAGSFDARAIRVSKTFAKLLDQAGVSWAVLGDEENCCGDPARRAGNEFVFQMLAIQNISLLNSYGVKHIVTTCPHGYHTFKNEYPTLGADFRVQHHTEYLLELLQTGKLEPKGMSNQIPVTYHDSCYLGRVNGTYEAPRDIIKILKTEIRELKRSRKNGFCCGAGGAQMFKEEEKGTERVNTNRAREIIENGSRIVLANCPFCLTMLEDGIKDHDKEDEVKVMDLAEYLSSCLAD